MLLWHQAIETKDLVYIQGIFKAQAERKRESDAERVRRAAALQANPFDVEAQRAMEEEINKDNVETLRQNVRERVRGGVHHTAATPPPIPLPPSLPRYPSPPYFSIPFL